MQQKPCFNRLQTHIDSRPRDIGQTGRQSSDVGGGRSAAVGRCVERSKGGGGGRQAVAGGHERNTATQRSARAQTVAQVPRHNASSMTPAPPDTDTTVAMLPNGVRVVTIALPQLDTASVSVFVRSGSQHESARQSGISHVVEHMAFKGTATRDCQRINLDAERLGAEVNAHTDKDHTAYHMVGLARDAEAFVGMLGDIVLNGSFPAAELERERQVILHELVEDEEDALSAAYKLFDALCYGTHALARPVIGSRRNIERFTRDELLGYVRQQTSGENVVVGVAGPVDARAVLAAAQAAFGGLARGQANRIAAPQYLGGLRARRLAGCSQTHVVMGFPIPPATAAHQASVVAAAVFGEGMSSPLLDQIRERRGLAYYAACSADVGELAGQFVVEASTAPAQVEELVTEVARLLGEHARGVDAVALERARNQLMVRSLRARERPVQRIEAAALDLFVHGRVRSRDELLAGYAAISAEQARQAFVAMLAATPAVAMAGKVGKGLDERVRALMATLAPPTGAAAIIGTRQARTRGTRR
jgi:predicted Zn-dependent peptidase